MLDMTEGMCEDHHKHIQPLAEIKTIEKAIQNALYLDNLHDRIGFICQWEEYRKNQTEYKESCYGTAVSRLLFIHGIDLSKIGRLG